MIIKVNKKSNMNNYIDIDIYTTNQIDDFILNESNSTFGLMCDLQNRFCYFLDIMNSSHLLSFIIDLKFNLSYNIVNNYSNTQINKFINKNNNELFVTLWVVNRYLSKFKRLQINRHDWLEFCYKYTS